MAAFAAAAEIVQRRTIRRERVFKDRQDPFDLLDHTLFNRYRFLRHALLDLANELCPLIELPTRRSMATPAVTQLAVTLSLLASGSFQWGMGELHGISQATACRCLHRVVSVIIGEKLRTTIKFPQTQTERTKVMHEFSQISGFPRVLGAIDCTHVAIRAPAGDMEYVYINRKNYHSMNVQAICDANMTITDVVARYPGSTHDSFILANSKIARKFSDGELGEGCMVVRGQWLSIKVLANGSTKERPNSSRGAVQQGSFAHTINC
ncbi:PREDICTED: putative nuclease HARBI1 [Priapulus caudatus]|uniref:Putative nuclease HARBI1 n=1 Tax=Priapulus caudatus TaxID=37621 RepID=A0ABM1EMG1_PRICU|nr:PREDICTED: putative nuclease HARBI1 [Priapulus caudatus]